MFAFVVLLAGAIAASAQVSPEAYGGKRHEITVGAEGSYFSPNWKPNNLGGIGIYGDYSFSHIFSLEGEARFLRFNQFQNVHEDTYAAGPRFTYTGHRWLPYVKVLAGAGKFQFPPQYQRSGSYFLWVFGGGVDYRLTPRFSARAEYEYQVWRNFNARGYNDQLNPQGVSIGISYRLR